VLPAVIADLIASIVSRTNLIRSLLFTLLCTFWVPSYGPPINQPTD